MSYLLKNRVGLLITILLISAFAFFTWKEEYTFIFGTLFLLVFLYAIYSFRRNPDIKSMSLRIPGYEFAVERDKARLATLLGVNFGKIEIKPYGELILALRIDGTNIRSRFIGNINYGFEENAVIELLANGISVNAVSIPKHLTGQFENATWHELELPTIPDFLTIEAKIRIKDETKMFGQISMSLMTTSKMSP